MVFLYIELNPYVIHAKSDIGNGTHNSAKLYEHRNRPWIKYLH